MCVLFVNQRWYILERWKQWREEKITNPKANKLKSVVVNIESFSGWLILIWIGKKNKDRTQIVEQQNNLQSHSDWFFWHNYPHPHLSQLPSLPPHIIHSYTQSIEKSCTVALPMMKIQFFKKKWLVNFRQVIQSQTFERWGNTECVVVCPHICICIWNFELSTWILLHQIVSIFMNNRCIDSLFIHPANRFIVYTKHFSHWTT